LNNKAKLTMRKAYGFRTFSVIELAKESRPMTQMLMRPKRAYLPTAMLAIVVVVAVGAGFKVMGSSVEVAHVIPAPAIDEPAGAQTSEVAVLAVDASGASRAYSST
jgi:hypothetical protein